MSGALAISQKRSGIEQYYYSGHQGISIVVPKVYYQNKKNWYAEVRYNYEALETFSFNIGKTFSKENVLSYSVTPLAGIMFGKLKGGSLGLNLEVEYKKLFLSSEAQYAFSSSTRDNQFFFNWSQLGYNITSCMYAGLALQVTHIYDAGNTWEPGIMAAFSCNKFTFPFYIFNPERNKRYFVLGINIEWGGT